MKKFAIIGGGISGLAVLHYLKKRYAHDVDITLYERSSSVGGCISSIETQGFFFETGPNGFLTNQPNTLEFLEEIGFSDQLIEANQEAKRRYIQLNGQLHLLPTDPLGFIQTPLLSTSNKFRLIGGLFRRNISKNQSVYDYTTARFGLAVTQRLVDPFLTGIYAGNIKRLHMGSAFPQLGQRKGKPRLCSFKSGMGSLIQHLSKRYQAHIQTDREITSLDQIKADHIICCAPAYVASDLLGMDILNQIPYASLAVVGMLIKNESFKTLPDGFGYLVPSTEGKDVLGVLLESNIFTRQTGQGQTFIRVMLGGSHHPAIINDSPETILAKALKEIDQIYGLKDHPIASSVKLWPKGIPQYELAYPTLRQAIGQELKKRPHVYLCANYLDGISFNDCINNAKRLIGISAKNHINH